MTCLYTTTTTTTSPVGSLKRKRAGANITVNISPSLPHRKTVRVVPTISKMTTGVCSNPQQTLESIMSKRGLASKQFSYQDIPEAFDIAEKDIDAWTLDVLSAVRRGDVDQLREFHQQQGRNLKCSNNFGETLLHIACRKGLVSVVAFLIEEVGMPANIHDDTGRTPLHDAFWTPEPNEDLIDLMITQCSDMLFAQDKRGHAPLQYARRSHWDTWSKYIQSRNELLTTNTLNARSQ